MSDVITTSEFPLSGASALRIIREIAVNHTHRVKFSYHAKSESLPDDNLTFKQVLSSLSNRSNHITEGPYPDARGSWICNVRGVGAGDNIETVVKLTRLESDPSLFVITVWCI